MITTYAKRLWILWRSPILTPTTNQMYRAKRHEPRQFSSTSETKWSSDCTPIALSFVENHRASLKGFSVWSWSKDMFSGQAASARVQNPENREIRPNNSLGNSREKGKGRSPVLRSNSTKHPDRANAHARSSETKRNNSPVELPPQSPPDIKPNCFQKRRRNPQEERNCSDVRNMTNPFSNFT